MPYKFNKGVLQVRKWVETLRIALFTLCATMLAVQGASNGFTLISLSAEQNISKNWSIGMSARLLEHDHHQVRYFTGATLYLDYNFTNGGAE